MEENQQKRRVHTMPDLLFSNVYAVQVPEGTNSFWVTCLQIWCQISRPKMIMPVFEVIDLGFGRWEGVCLSVCKTGTFAILVKH